MIQIIIICLGVYVLIQIERRLEDVKDAIENLGEE